MSDLNLPPDEQADHSGPVADPDSFGSDSAGPDEAASSDDDRASAPEPGAVPPPD